MVIATPVTRKETGNHAILLQAHRGKDTGQYPNVGRKQRI
jgi:hypothetical protein